MAKKAKVKVSHRRDACASQRRRGQKESEAAAAAKRAQVEAKRRFIGSFVKFRAKKSFLSFLPPEILPLKHRSRILGQWANPVSGSRKSQANTPSAKHHRA